MPLMVFAPHLQPRGAQSHAVLRGTRTAFVVERVTYPSVWTRERGMNGAGTAYLSGDVSIRLLLGEA